MILTSHSDEPHALMEIVKQWAALRSKDPRTKVAACIYDTVKKGMYIGYNGFPPGIPDESEIWERTSSTQASMAQSSMAQSSMAQSSVPIGTDAGAHDAGAHDAGAHDAITSGGAYRTCVYCGATHPSGCMCMCQATGLSQVQPRRPIDTGAGLLKYDLVIHAEVNALYRALQAHVDTSKCILVCTHKPCPRCMLNVVLCAGIKRVYYDACVISETARESQVVKELAIRGKVEMIQLQ